MTGEFEVADNKCWFLSLFLYFPMCPNCLGTVLMETCFVLFCFVLFECHGPINELL